MITVAAMVTGVAFVGACIFLVTGLRKVPPHTPRSGRPRPTAGQVWARYTRRPAGKAGRIRDLQLLIGITAGLLVFLLTGWLIAIPLIPAVAFLLPILFGRAPRSDVALLEALDRWVRTLATTLPLGRDVAYAIKSSRATAPPLIADEIRELADRLTWGWDSREALQRFADRLDSPDADAVIASLILALRRTDGITANLLAIADSLQERLRALRQIESERARPRQTARLITIISGVMIAGTALLGRGYFAPYSTPVGQLIVSGLAIAYVGSLVILYRMSMPRRRERILVRAEPVGVRR